MTTQSKPRAVNTWITMRTSPSMAILVRLTCLHSTQLMSRYRSVGRNQGVALSAATTSACYSV